MEPYTKEFLAKNHIQIFADGKPLFTNGAHPFFDEERVFPYFITGSEPAILPPNIRSSTSIAELTQLGFAVQAGKPDVKWHQDQRVCHILMRIDDATKPLPNMPKDTRFEYDSANQRIRLIGRNVGEVGRTDWLSLKLVYPKKQQEFKTMYDMLNNREKVLKQYRKSSLHIDLREQIPIPDIPIGITDSNEIVCLKKPESVGEEIEPRMLVLGGPRLGKTTFVHGMLDRGRKYWGVRPCILNDSQSENGQWCFPDPENGISFGLPYDLQKVNETPAGLPTFYLTPNTSDTTDILNSDIGIGFKISLPFKEIIQNTHYYFDLQDSAKYFTAKSDQYLTCDTPDELINTFATGDKTLSYEDYKAAVKAKEMAPRSTPPDPSIKAVSAIFNDLYQKRIVDKWCNVPSVWRVVQNGKEVGEFNPFLAAISVGLCPVIETGDLLNKGYFPSYFTFFARSLFDAQRTNLHFIDNNIKVWAFIDEVTDIAKQGMNTVSANILEQILRKGGYRRIGAIVATQFYDHIPHVIRNNCNYVICFNAGETADEIVHHLGLAKTEANHIKDLVKFEFMAYAKDTPFVIYDYDGNKRTSFGPLYCTVLPPLSIHSPPVKKKAPAAQKQLK